MCKAGRNSHESPTVTYDIYTKTNTKRQYTEQTADFYLRYLSKMFSILVIWAQEPMDASDDLTKTKRNISILYNGAGILTNSQIFR